jgi:hypothetical protein
MTFAIYCLKLRHTLTKTKASTYQTTWTWMFLKALYIFQNILFDTSQKASLYPIVTSRWRLLFRSVHFRSSFFAHCLSLTDFHSLVNFSSSFWFWFFRHHLVPLGTCLFQDITRNSSISTISTRCTQPVYWRYRTLFILYFIFSIATDPSKNVIYFYLKFWIQG